MSETFPIDVNNAEPATGQSLPKVNHRRERCTEMEWKLRTAMSGVISKIGTPMAQSRIKNPDTVAADCQRGQRLNCTGPAFVYTPLEMPERDKALMEDFFLLGQAIREHNQKRAEELSLYIANCNHA